jgi:hypothetical protein
VCNSDATASPVNAWSIVISSASHVFVTDGSHLFDHKPSGLDEIELAIMFGPVTAAGEASLSGLKGAFLQIENVSLPESPSFGASTFCDSGLGPERCIESHSSLVKSLLVPVPAHGNYSMRASASSVNNTFEIFDGSSSFEVDSNHSFLYPTLPARPDIHFPLRPTSASATYDYSRSESRSD